MLLPSNPAGATIGMSTSNRCSPSEPQDIDWVNVCAEESNVVPSMRMAGNVSPSRRDMVTLTLEEEEVAGHSTRSAKRVEMTNDLLFFDMLWPGAARFWK